MNTLTLPPELEPHRGKLMDTLLSYVKIKPQASRPTEWWESKVGGWPYLPKEVPFPATPQGQPLFFLAQINFSEIPNAPAPLPQAGIVQFYIDDDDYYGMDPDDMDNADHFRVLYFPNVVQDAAKLQTNFPQLRPYDGLPHHPDVSYPLSFSIETEIAPVSDYRFWQHMGQDFFQQFGQREWDLMDTYGDVVTATGHKLGGYAYFTQDDPRSPSDPMLLLFQLDSDEPMDLMWGDMGVGHFFIREKDLVARDFSKTSFNWDCC